MLFPLFYHPPLIWFQALHKAKDCSPKIHCNPLYIKQHYFNRCIIAHSQGIQKLTIPVQKYSSNKTKLKDIKICRDQPWQRNHWRALTTAYNNSSFFDFFADSYLPLYEKPYSFLVDFNLEQLQINCENLGISIPECSFDTEENLTDIYLSEEKISYDSVFADSEKMENENYRFLSVLDYIFCTGNPLQ